jgi:hypothetical protein
MDKIQKSKTTKPPEVTYITRMLPGMKISKIQENPEFFPMKKQKQSKKYD